VKFKKFIQSRNAFDFKHLLFSAEEILRNGHQWRREGYGNTQTDISISNPAV
jgi:hypothetical protein